MASIKENPKQFSPLGLGCWVYQPDLWSEERSRQVTAAMQVALERGLNHFDTASGYGHGESEKLVGRFLQGRRALVFLASKANYRTDRPLEMLEAVKASLERLQTDCIDLYYIHWPKQALDVRRPMEGLEMARQQGLIRSVGVSNFNVAQIEQAAEVGQIDANQIPYSLFWREPERAVIPYCQEHGIGVVTYGTIAYGILTGKFDRALTFAQGDLRNNILLFVEPTWGMVYEAAQEMIAVAREVGRPLHHLAIRWSLSRPGVVCALAGANSSQQAAENAAALEGEIPQWALDRLTEISDRVMAKLPQAPNPQNLTP